MFEKACLAEISSVAQPKDYAVVQILKMEVLKNTVMLTLLSLFWTIFLTHFRCRPC